MCPVSHCTFTVFFTFENYLQEITVFFIEKTKSCKNVTRINAIDSLIPRDLYLVQGAFKNYVDKILAFFDHLLPCSVDIFYGINVEKKVDIYGPPTYLVL